MQIKTYTYKKKGEGYNLEPEGNFLTRDLSARRIPMDEHIERMLQDGWELLNSSGDSGHVRVGKTLALGAMTGGLSLLFGASRTPQTITLTFKK